MAGVVAHAAGRQMVEKRPVAAVRVMEWRVLFPAALAAGGAGLAIGLGVWLEPGEDASVETKKLLAASVAALTAFLSAAWIKSAEEASEQWIGKPIAAAFSDVFRQRFRPNTEPANAIFDDAWQGRGWARATDRRARARAVEKGLADQPQPPLAH
jgi:hypothetical protein